LEPARERRRPHSSTVARAFMAAAGGKVSTSELVRWRWRFSDLLATRPTPAWQHCLREDIPNQSAFSIF